MTRKDMNDRLDAEFAKLDSNALHDLFSEEFAIIELEDRKSSLVKYVALVALVTLALSLIF